MTAIAPESPVQKTPGWLEVLENKRNKPHKLAHDIGAGAPCLNCKDRCKGLNLHFWRKLCIECKCRKEDHEIQEDEDYAQFEILFGSKKVKRTTLKFNAQNKSFDWIPPNVPPELAVDYLNAIPESKLPISNSEGARYRKQQLEKQVPLHDVNPSACHNLSDKETKEFEKYLNNLKSHVIGQGKILKYQSPVMLSENYVRGISPNMTAVSEAYGSVTAQAAEIKGRLNVATVPRYAVSSRTVATESYPPQQSPNTKVVKHSQSPDSTGVNLHSATNLEKPYWASHPGGQKPLDAIFASPKPFHTPEDARGRGDRKEEADPYNVLDRQGSLRLRTPGSFIDEIYSVGDKQNNNDDNVNEGSGSEDVIRRGENPSEETPSSICKDSLSKFSQLSVCSDEVPFVPVREAAKASSPKRNGDFAKEKEDGEDENASDSFPTPPATCQQCLEILYPGEVVVRTERAGSLALWHAKCFVCEICQELLVDLVYFYHKGKVYCGRHYAHMTNIPRCHACDELIFVKEYTQAEGESYHVPHFCCFHCDQPLGGKQYIPKDDFPVCLDCYRVKYGKDCRTCRLPIAPGEQRVSWKDLDFHVAPECFRCTACLKPLLGGKLIVKNSNTFCSKDCVQRFFE